MVGACLPLSSLPTTPKPSSGQTPLLCLSLRTPWSPRGNQVSRSWFLQEILLASKGVVQVPSRGRDCSVFTSVVSWQAVWKRSLSSLWVSNTSTLFFPLLPQFPPSDGLLRDQYGFPQLLHQPCGSLLCQPEIQELLPGRVDPS